MLLVDATTAEHARGIRTVIAGVVGALAESATEDVSVVAGPGLPLPESLRSRRVALARTRPGRLLYQRALLPLDVAVQRRRGNTVDRVLLLDAYAPMIRPNRDLRYAALVHDVLPLSHPQYWSPAKQLVKRAAFASLRREVTLFTSSEFTAQEIGQQLGVEARLVRFGCGQLTDAEADLALQAPLPERRPYVLYVGAFEPRKGVLSLVEAFERLINERVELQLVLAGDGSPDYCAALTERVDRGPIRGRVDIVKNPDRRVVLDLVTHAGVLAMPTSAEGFGLPVLEALALGTPVVANDILAIRSWAKRSVTYSCVDAPNEWATALDAALALDDGHRRRGQIVAQAFRWRECAAKLIVF